MQAQENISNKTDTSAAVMATSSPADEVKERARQADINANRLMNENLVDSSGLFRLNLKQVIPGSVLTKHIYEPLIKNDKGYDVYILCPSTPDPGIQGKITKEIETLVKNRALAVRRREEADAYIKKYDMRLAEQYGKSALDAERIAAAAEKHLPILLEQYNDKYSSELEKMKQFRSQVFAILESVDIAIDEANRNGEEFYKKVQAETEALLKSEEKPAKGKK